MSILSTPERIFNMHYFIEMGQGIIKSGPFHVSTSTLYSCVLIAGLGNGGYAGAYHYPSVSLDDDGVVQDMNRWAATLQPTQLILVFASDTTGTGMMGSTQGDRIGLRNWCHVKGVANPTIREATGAGMEYLQGGAIDAGSKSTLQADFDVGAVIDLSNMPAGHYLHSGGFGLVGQNREAN